MSSTAFFPCTRPALVLLLLVAFAAAAESFVFGRYHRRTAENRRPAVALFLVTRTETAETRVERLGSSVPADKLLWSERVQQLLEYKREYGNVMVPRRFPPNPSLANFVARQRHLYRKHRAGEETSLTPQRIEQLTKIGFCWDASQYQGHRDQPIHKTRPTYNTVALERRREEAWWTRFRELKEIGKAAGTSPFTVVHSGTQLGQWVYAQRKEYRKLRSGSQPTSLRQKHVDALNDLDPKWWMSLSERRWEDRFEELYAFRCTHGHCMVPITHPNRKLANWVGNLRKANNGISKATAILTPERKKRLDDIGFVWDYWDHVIRSKGTWQSN